MTSAVSALQVALVAALEADSTLIARLASATSIYSGAAPEGSTKPYLVVGASSEGPTHQFGRQGVENDETLHIWDSKPHKLNVLAIYVEVARVLSGTLTVAGFTARRGTARLITVLLDPDSKGAHGIVQYSVAHWA